MATYTARCTMDTAPFSDEGTVMKTQDFQVLYRALRSNTRYARRYGNDMRWEVLNDLGELLYVFAYNSRDIDIDALAYWEDEED